MKHIVFIVYYLICIVIFLGQISIGKEVVRALIQVIVYLVLLLVADIVFYNNIAFNFITLLIHGRFIIKALNYIVFKVDDEESI